MKRWLHPNDSRPEPKRRSIPAYQSLDLSPGTPFETSSAEPVENNGTSPATRYLQSREVSYDSNEGSQISSRGCGTNDIICLGSVLELPAQIREHPTVKTLRTVRPENDSTDFVLLRMVNKGAFCWLAGDDNSPFGCLSSRVSAILKRLMKNPCIKLRYMTAKDRLDKASHHWKKSGKATNLSIDINIYGHPHIATEIGDTLANARMFLQPPIVDPDDRPYENPQYLQLPNVSALDLIGQADEMSEVQEKTEPKLTSATEIESLMDHIPQPNFLSQTFADHRIQTNLIKHQSEAVDFITKRETNDLPPEMTLWRPHTAENGSFSYKHVITGAKSSVMEDVCGGIIADDMGLGKTLSMLSAIVKASNRAVEFAIERTSAPSKSWLDIVPSKATLVVVPSALLLESWTDEIEKHAIAGTLSVHRYHDAGKRVNVERLVQHDIVLTTYASIAADFCRGRSVLHHVEWYRLVLDEAHYIRNPATKQFRAINAIPSKIRWCLSGTPIQNSLEDLGALVKFLKVPILDDLAIYRRHISVPIMSGTTGRFINLRRLLGAVCLRRTKALLNLPEPITETQLLNLSHAETVRYKDFGYLCEHTVRLAVAGHTLRKANQYVLQAILGMRLFCNNGEQALLNRLSGDRLPQDPQEALSYLQTSAGSTCSQCATEITAMYQADDQASGSLTMCQHLLCGECRPVYEDDLNNTLDGERAQCPICGFKGARDAFIVSPSSPANSPKIMAGGFPTKLLALLGNVKLQSATEKCIVFSFWKSTLDTAAQMFDEHGIGYFRIHGQLSASKRSKVLKEFERSTQTRILLITLGTGAVGLNKLKVANRIHILEPQWNPSVESQAIGRVLRLGQEKSVTITRYIMKGTVEGSVQNRQLRKLQLARGGFGLTKDEDTTRRVDEIMSLLCPEEVDQTAKPSVNATNCQVQVEASE